MTGLVLIGSTSAYFKYKSAKCDASLKTSKNVFCFIKSYTRSHPLVNFGFTLLRKVPTGMVGLDYSPLRGILLTLPQLLFTVQRKKTSGSYFTVMNVTDIPICKVLFGGRSNRLTDHLTTLANALAIDMLELCSRTGDFKMMNVTMYNTTFNNLWPTGEYISMIRFFDSEDENIVSLTTFSIK